MSHAKRGDPYALVLGAAKHWHWEHPEGAPGLIDLGSLVYTVTDPVDRQRLMDAYVAAVKRMWQVKIAESKARRDAMYAETPIANRAGLEMYQTRMTF